MTTVMRIISTFVDILMKQLKLLNCTNILPVQVLASVPNFIPSGQLQIYDPTVLVQVWLQSCVLSVHSLIS